MAYTGLVYKIIKNVSCYNFSSQFSTLQSSEHSRNKTKGQIDVLPYYTDLTIHNPNLSSSVKKVIQSSWSKNTSKQYKTYLEKWEQYVSKHQIKSIEIHHVLEFLNELFQEGLGYSAINTARSALSTIVYCNGFPVGSHPLVIRFVKGVFKLRPSLSKYTLIWDPHVVLKMLENWYPNSDLCLKRLTYKLAMLAALITAQRVQTLSLLDTKYMLERENEIVFSVKEFIKTTKPGHHIEPIISYRYKHKSLCIRHKHTTKIPSPRPLCNVFFWLQEWRFLLAATAYLGLFFWLHQW